jgi:ABC-type branched-subunit amino acid transport system substrate-binding protein
MFSHFNRVQPNGRAGVVAVGLVALGIGLTLVATPRAGAQTPTAKIAMAAAATGAASTFGTPIIDGARLAVEEANASGEAPKIELVIHDDASSDARAREIAREIIASDTLAVIGPATTPTALAVGPIYAEAGIVCIGPITTGDSVTDNATFFRSSFSTSEGGEALANYLHHVLGGTRAIVLFKEDGYGRPATAGFKNAAERLGITTTYLSFNTAAEAEEVARDAARDPDHPAIILAMIDAAPVLTVLRRQGVQGPILGTNVVAGEFFSKLFADQPEERDNPGFFTDGVYGASPLIFDSANAETLAFVARFHARFGRDPSYITVQGYEAARFAIAAVRATASTSSAPDLKTRRAMIRSYLVSLDGPAHAIAGLNGPLWFTPGRGRQQALRMGRFWGGKFESAPAQLVPVRTPDRSDIASGAVVDVGSGRYALRQQVVYTGLFLNEIARVDVAQSTFSADFYLWMRFARGSGPGVADPADIKLPNLVRGSFDPSQPVAQGDLDDGTTYRLWQVTGDFKNDFDLRRYPADRQTLAIRFFNARAASDRVVYVLDQRALDPTIGTPRIETVASPSGVTTAAAAQSPASPAVPLAEAFGNSVAPAAFHNLTQWDALGASERRDDLVTASSLGDPRLVGLERVRELSGFKFTVELQRRMIATLAKTLLPLGLMALIMYASLYFPPALVKEKVTVAITGALSGAVLLSSINAQLGSVGYLIAIEYGFYAFFILCLLCIVAVLAAERLRSAGRQPMALAVEQSARYLFLLGFAGTAVAAWFAYSRS